MAHVAPTKSKINTNPTQLACDRAAQRAPVGGKKSRGGRGPARVSGDTRESVRDSARVVVEVGCGILVYPPEEAGEPWRAVFTENGRRRFRQAMTEAELASKLAKVTERRLCRRFAAPVIAAVTCQDITPGHMQQIVNAAPTASEGDRLHRCLSAMVTAGIKGGYLTSPRLREVHWQAGDRPVPEPAVSTSGE